VGDKLFFLSQGAVDYDLWVTDGTPQGTKLLHARSPHPGPNQFHPFGAYVQPASMVALGRRVLISRHSPEHGEELWISDGTVEGTRLLKDLVPGLAGSSPRLMTRVGDTVYFVAGGWLGGHAVIGTPSDIGLWKTDGTARGTRLVKSFAHWSGPNHLTAVGDQLFFVGGDRQNGYGLWRTDGTDRGTRLLLAWELSSVIVFPIDGETFVGPKIGWLTDVRGELYFQFNDGRHGSELWRSDGTRAGTWMVTDQRPGPDGAEPSNLTPFKGRLFFAAHDDAVGVELFSIDPREVSRTLTGSARSEIWTVTRRGDRIEVRSGGERIFAAPLDSISELILNTRGGNDMIVVDARDQELGVRLRIDAGRGRNTLWIKSGTVTASGEANGGRLNLIVAPGANLITSDLNASRLRILRTGRVLHDLEGVAVEPTAIDVRKRSGGKISLPLVDWLKPAI
jgi:ELWxxDGT repeat protein